MDDSALTARLAIHLDAFQESFEELSSQSTIPAFCKYFAQIVSGNFVTTDVNIYFKPNPDAEWQAGFVKNKQSRHSLVHIPLSLTPQSGTLDQHYPLSLVLPVQHHVIFAILLGRKLDVSEYSEFDSLLLQMFGQLLANAYQSMQSHMHEKQLIFTLNHRVSQLNSLVDTGIQISRSKTDRTVLTQGLEQAVAMTNASRGRIRIKQKPRNRYVYFPNGVTSKDIERATNRISAEFTFQKRTYSIEICDKESRSGVESFEKTDLSILQSLTRQMQVALENHDLVQQRLEKQRIEQEILVAGEIQKELLPDDLPDIPGYAIAGFNIPSSTVGGDYYDCVAMQDGRFALVVADVSGHGIPASLLVNSFHASLHSFLTSQVSLSKLVQRLNTVIHAAAPINKFITAFLAILDPATGSIEYTSAGHNPAYLSTPDVSCQQLRTGGIMLGMMGFDLPVETATVALEQGQRLFIYTDGIPEAENRKRDMFEDDRLTQFFIDHPHLPPAEFLDTLMNDVNTFTGGASQGDDITALYIKRDDENI